MREDVNWIRKVVGIELLIEKYGICNAVGAFIQALENIQEERMREDPEFEITQHYKNIEHDKQILGFAMGAMDLDTRYGEAEARKVAAERFSDNMKSIGVMG